MKYNEDLRQKVRKILEGYKGFDEKKMFGGVCFLLNGNMACGIIKDELIVRVGPENHEKCLQMKHARIFDITGRSMKGWVMVAQKGLTTKKDLASWVERGARFALTLPDKQKKQ